VFYFLQNPSLTNDIVCEICPYAVDFPNVFEGEDFLWLFFGTFQFDDSHLSTHEMLFGERAKRGVGYLAIRSLANNTQQLEVCKADLEGAIVRRGHMAL
jgi:hypothetical protein